MPGNLPFLDGDEVVYSLHTDNADLADKVRALVGEYATVKVSFIEGPLPRYETAAACHKRDLTENPGAALIYVCPDNVIPDNTFSAISQKLSSGFKLLMCAGIRTVGEFPPLTDSQGLCDWSIHHMHQIARDLVWGWALGSQTPSNLYFRSPDSFCIHAFHLHPLCVVNDGQSFDFKNTIDDDLVLAFEPRETDIFEPREVMMVEVTDDRRRFPSNDHPLMIEEVVEWASMRTNSRHRGFFDKQLVVVGGESQLAKEISGKILNRLGG